MYNDSINNSIIICPNCTKKLELLGYNYLILNHIKEGDNSCFIQFCKDYKNDKGNNNIIQRYKSKGLTF